MDIDFANNSFSRMKGLMFKNTINKGLLLKPANSIHTLFMKFPIDVVYIDKSSKIIKVSKNMKPWKISNIVLKSHAILELPEGTINKYRIKVSDVVEFLLE